MNDRYPQIYSKIYAQQSQPRGTEGDEVSAISLVRQAIEEAEKLIQGTDKLKLREDARLLIFVLFKNMIVLPILMDKSIGETQLSETVRADLMFIMKHVTQDERGEISGHAVLATIVAHWKDLKAASLQIWG